MQNGVISRVVNESGMKERTNLNESKSIAMNRSSMIEQRMNLQLESSYCILIIIKVLILVERAASTSPAGFGGPLSHL